MSRHYINDIKELFSHDPATDVEIILHRDPKGRVVKGDGIRGNFTTQTLREAANKVLAFPAAKDTSMVLMTRVKIETPMPLSLVKRYNLNRYSQQVPFFFDSKTDQFVVFLDTRFLRHINLSHLYPYLRMTGHISAYKTEKLKDGTIVVGVWCDKIEHIRQKTRADKEASPLFSLLYAWDQFVMSLKDGQRRIVVRFHDQVSDNSTLMTKIKLNEPGASPIASTLSLEALQTVQFGNKHYLCDEKGIIDPEKMFELNKEVEQLGGLADIQRFYRSKSQGGQILVLEYSEETWAFLVRIIKQLNTLHTELGAFLSKGVDGGCEVDSLALDEGFEPLKIARS